MQNVLMYDVLCALNRAVWNIHRVVTATHIQSVAAHYVDAIEQYRQQTAARRLPEQK